LGRASAERSTIWSAGTLDSPRTRVFGMMTEAGYLSDSRTRKLESPPKTHFHGNQAQQREIEVRDERLPRGHDRCPQINNGKWLLPSGLRGEVERSEGSARVFWTKPINQAIASACSV
jgi:hypothetical protein